MGLKRSDRTALEVTDICWRKGARVRRKPLWNRGTSDEPGKDVAASLPCGTGKRKAEGEEENGRRAG